MAAPRCSGRRVIEPGETLDRIALECFGSRAYAPRLAAVNNVRNPSKVAAGTVFETWGFEAFLRSCETKDVCRAMERVHARFRSVQPELQVAATSKKDVPLTVRPLLTELARLLRDLPDSSAKSPLEAARKLLERLAGGSWENPERSYDIDLVHQHLAHALDRLAPLPGF